MKKFRIIALAVLSFGIVNTVSAQTKTETFKVSGNCGMCKSKIEKAAKDAGAKSAEWNEDTKMLTVSFKSSTTNTAKIQKSIAKVGYDNAGAKATQESYDKLHGCCKYDRTTTEVKESCCKDGKCTKEGHNGKDCCKDDKCSKEGHDGKDCCKKS